MRKVLELWEHGDQYFIRMGTEPHTAATHLMPSDDGLAPVPEVYPEGHDEFRIHGSWMDGNRLISLMYRRVSDGAPFYDDVPEARERKFNVIPSGAKYV